MPSFVRCRRLRSSGLRGMARPVEPVPAQSLIVSRLGAWFVGRYRAPWQAILSAEALLVLIGVIALPAIEDQLAFDGHI